MRSAFAIVSSLLRLGVAAWLAWLCLQHLPAYDARAGLDALPDYDYLVEAERLRAEERFSEALLVVDAGSASSSDGFEISRLAELRTRIEAERDDWMRRLGDVGEGALTGQGESLEALAGAVTADLFVFGDLRDLVIQGGRELRGEDADEVIVALSAAGLVLTVTPALDLGAALLKFARKVGALTEAFAQQVARLAREAVQQRSVGPLGEVAQDMADLGRSTRPAGALAILRHIDDPAELKAAARFAREQPAGGFALWVGGKPALQLIEAGAERQALLLRAARKGRAGVEYAARNAGLLLRPHPLLGLLKGFYKGNVPQLLQELLSARAPLLLGLLAGWALFELLLLAARLARPARRAPREAAAPPPPAPPARPERRAPTLF